MDHVIMVSGRSATYVRRAFYRISSIPTRVAWGVEGENFYVWMGNREVEVVSIIMQYGLKREFPRQTTRERPARGFGPVDRQEKTAPATHDHGAA